MTKSVSLKAPDISCDGCARSIKSVLGDLNGVQTVDVDVASKTVHVSFTEEITETDIRTALDDAGFPAD